MTTWVSCRRSFPNILRTQPFAHKFQVIRSTGQSAINRREFRSHKRSTSFIGRTVWRELCDHCDNRFHPNYACSLVVQNISLQWLTTSKKTPFDGRHSIGINRHVPFLSSRQSGSSRFHWGWYPNKPNSAILIILKWSWWSRGYTRPFQMECLGSNSRWDGWNEALMIADGSDTRFGSFSRICQSGWHEALKLKPKGQ